MCQATVYLEDEEIMQDVMSVETVPGGIRLTSMFEASAVVPAKIREVDLIGHKVMLTALPDEK